MPYRCTPCGLDHDDLPDLGAAYPDPWFTIPPAERSRRVQHTPDTCVIDGAEFYIRGVLLLPLVDAASIAAGHDAFGLGVWISQGRAHFQTYLDHPDTPDIGPFTGWFCTRIRGYAPNTDGLRSRAHFRGNNQRPTIELEPTDHSLAVDQRTGITLDRAWQIVHAYAPVQT